MHFREDGSVPEIRRFEDYLRSFDGTFHLPIGISIDESPYWSASEESGHVTELSRSFADPDSGQVECMVVSQAIRRRHPLAPVSAQEGHRFELAQHLSYFIANHGEPSEQDAFVIDEHLEQVIPSGAKLRVAGQEVEAIALRHGGYRAVATAQAPYIVVVGTSEGVDRVIAVGVAAAAPQV